MGQERAGPDEIKFSLNRNPAHVHARIHRLGGERLRAEINGGLVQIARGDVRLGKRRLQKTHHTAMTAGQIKNVAHAVVRLVRGEHGGLDAVQRGFANAEIVSLVAGEHFVALADGLDYVGGGGGNGRSVGRFGDGRDEGRRRSGFAGAPRFEIRRGRGGIRRAHFAERDIVVAPLVQRKVGNLVTVLQAKFVHRAIDAVLGFFQRRIDRVVVADNPAVVLDLARGLFEVAHRAFVGMVAVYVNEIERAIRRGRQQRGRVAFVQFDSFLFERGLKVRVIERREIKVVDVQLRRLHHRQNLFGEVAGLRADLGADAAFRHQLENVFAARHDAAVLQMLVRQQRRLGVGEKFAADGEEIPDALPGLARGRRHEVARGGV